jgi:glycerophosphoryl diester phosphodiesterase
LKLALKSGVDIIRLDIRLTKEKVPVVWEHANIKSKCGTRKPISSLTFKEIEHYTSNSNQNVVKFEEALETCFSKALIIIEMNQAQTFKYLMDSIQKYAKKKSQWQLLIFSSRSPKELYRVKKIVPHAQLGLTQRHNSFTFLRYVKNLELSAVGFHRLNTNRLALSIARKIGLFTYAYTVNRPQSIKYLENKKIDAIYTDRPDIILNSRRNYLKNNKIKKH